MVDTADLKSAGPKTRTGSSPVFGINNFASVMELVDMTVLEAVGGNSVVGFDSPRSYQIDHLL